MKDYTFLFELERNLHSPKTRSDKHQLMKLLSSNFFEFGSSGRQWSREDILERLPLEKEEYEIQSSNFKAQELATGVVLVTYVSARVNQGPENEFLRSSIWKESPDGWQMVFHQGTKVCDK